MKRLAIQQGDVRLVPCSAPKGERKLIEHGIVAYGEGTGHKHRVTKGKVYEIAGSLYVSSDGVLEMVHDASHERHGPCVKKETGWRKVERVREYDHFREEAREVRD